MLLGFFAGCSRDPNVRKQKYLESGKRYFDKGKYKEASIQFSNALRVDKNFADAHYQLAHTYEKLGSFQQAYIELMRTVQLQPDNVPARVDLGNLYLVSKQAGKAQEQATYIQQNHPDNADGHALLAGIASSTGDRERALNEIQRAIQLDPKKSQYYTTLGVLQATDRSSSALGDPNAEENLKKAIELDPSSMASRILLARFYERAKRYPEAAGQYEQAIKSDPKSLLPRVALANVYFRQNQQPKAEEILRQASQDLSDSPQGSRLLADYYFSTGRTQDAIKELESQANKYPKNLTLQESYVEALLQSGQADKAAGLIQKLVKDHPKDPQVQVLNGVMQLRDNKIDEAKATLQQAVKDAPNNQFAHFWLARAALMKGDRTTAEQNFRDAVRLAPTFLPAHEGLVQIAISKNDPAMLDEVADKVITTLPKAPVGYLWRATAELQRDQLDRAEADLGVVIRQAPKSALPYLQLGQIRIKQKKMPEAAQMFSKALDLDPKSVPAVKELMSIYFAQKQPEKAIQLAQTQIAKQPTVSGFYDLLASAQMQGGNFSGAEATLKKAMQINPEDNGAISLYSNTEAALGTPNNAMDAWLNWLKGHPSDANAYTMLGTLAEAANKKDVAQGYYQKALQIQPDQAVAANNLAYLMTESGGNIDVALTLAQNANRLVPDSPTFADTLAWIYYHKGTYLAARDLLEQAEKKQPNDPTVQYHLGMVYSKLSDHNNATLHLKKALELAPNSTPGQDAQKALSTIG